MMAAARRKGYSDAIPSAWSIDNVLVPNITDKATILSFARMAIDAYYINDTCAGWDHVGKDFNSSIGFGWEGDGLRGHIFADQSNSTVVISVKGTSKGKLPNPQPESYLISLSSLGWRWHNEERQRKRQPIW
jgi:lipase ATG15